MPRKNLAFSSNFWHASS